MKSEATLSRRDQLQLRAYDSLIFWNDHEGKVMMSLDAVVIIGIVALVVKTPDISRPGLVIATVGYLLTVGTWMYLACRTYNRMRRRFELAGSIEKQLGFSAHTAMSPQLKRRWYKPTYRSFRLTVGACLCLVVLVEFCCVLLNDTTP